MIWKKTPMWKTISISLCISIIIVSLASFFFNQGGEVLLRLGEVAALFIDVFSLFRSSKDINSHIVPESGKLILNIIIYGILIFLLLEGWRVLSKKNQS